MTAHSAHDKQTFLVDDAPLEAPEDAEGRSIEVEIVNRLGLHARAAAKFVKTVAAFSADVTVSHQGNSVCGRSIMGLMMLAAGCGSTITLDAKGPDAEDALRALTALIEGRFHEAD